MGRLIVLLLLIPSLSWAQPPKKYKVELDFYTWDQIVNAINDSKNYGEVRSFLVKGIKDQVDSQIAADIKHTDSVKKEETNRGAKVDSSSSKRPPTKAVPPNMGGKEAHKRNLRVITR